MLDTMDRCHLVCGLDPILEWKDRGGFSDHGKRSCGDLGHLPGLDTEDHRINLADLSRVVGGLHIR